MSPRHTYTDLEVFFNEKDLAVKRLSIGTVNNDIVFCYVLERKHII